jgi:hypothetical protein
METANPIVIGSVTLNNYLIRDYKTLNTIAKAVTATSKRDIAYRTVPGTYLNAVWENNDDNIIDYYKKYIPYTDPIDDTMLSKDGFSGIIIKRLGTSDQLKFKAFIEKIDDSYSPKWNDVTYVGRPDTFRVYSGLTRTISLTFLIANITGNTPVWSQVNKLAQFVSPKWTADGKMIAPVLSLAVLDMFNPEIGFFGNLRIGIEQDYPWDLNYSPSTQAGSPQGEGIKPMMVAIDVSFESMMNFLPANNASYYAMVDPLYSM